MSNGFTPQQIRAAQSLASGLPQGKAAKEAGVSRITVIRWLKNPEFKCKVEELSRKVEAVETQTFVQETKQRVRSGAVTLSETIDLLSEVIRDRDCKLSDRLKAADTLGKWLGWGDGKRYVQPPELPLKPFNHAEMTHKLDVLKSQAVVASGFLIEQAVTHAAQGDFQEATTVISKSVDLACECVADVPTAANVLAKQGFRILTSSEYDRLITGDQKSSALLQPLNFDRTFSWRWLKRQKSS